MISHIHIDPIHGKIELPPFIQMIINTEEFQRLRNLRQLGLAHWMFPGVCHTRYEHCIGVYHLTCVLLSHIQTNHPNMEMNDFFVNCVKAAGLLHDVGHGPFSHLWDEIDEQIGTKTWSHEGQSCRITQSIFDKYDIKIPGTGAVNINAPELISAFIVGDTIKLLKVLGPDHMFLSEIVNNKFCAIDVDKWDYILRDSYYLNNVIELPMEFTQCFEGASIEYDDDKVSHISYHKRDQKLVYQLFMNRKRLHEDCYQHPNVIIVGEMVLDALQLADKAGFRFMGLRFAEVHTDLEVFKHFDDSILNMIEVSKEMDLSAAQKIIRRIKMRAWYKYKTYTKGEANDYKDEFVNGSRTRPQSIAAARITMTDNIKFHGESADNDTLNVHNDEAVHRVIVYTAE